MISLLLADAAVVAASQRTVSRVEVQPDEFHDSTLSQLPSSTASFTTTVAASSTTAAAAAATAPTISTSTAAPAAAAAVYAPAAAAAAAAADAAISAAVAAAAHPAAATGRSRHLLCSRGAPKPLSPFKGTCEHNHPREHNTPDAPEACFAAVP